MGRQHGGEGGTALVQVLRHLPQLQTLDLGCALEPRARTSGDDES
jgi:hypothetical protein